MTDILGVILAGGQARRLGGGDKCLLELDDRPILAWISERLRPQVSEIILNANGTPSRFGEFGFPVVADTIPDFAGPLAGILAAMEWARAKRPDIAWIASVPGDAPFIPYDLVERLRSAQKNNDSELVCASSGGRTNPVCGLWRVDMAEALRTALTTEGVRKVDLWTARYRLATAEFPNQPIDPFFNINGPEDLATAQALARSRSGRRV